MTAFVPSPLTLVPAAPSAGTLRISVHGDLDYTTAEELLAAAVAAIDEQDLDELRLDFADLRICDSSGLSALLRIRRRSDTAGVRLHLDDRPPILDRLLDVSGTYEYLAGAPDSAAGLGRHSSTQD